MHARSSVAAFLFLAAAVRAQDPDAEKAPPLDPTAAGAAQQIWDPVTQGGQQVWFRRTFEVAKGARSVQIVASCDDQFELFLNGKRVTSSGMWEELVVVDAGSLKPGKHVLAVHAKNRGGPAALVLWLTWTDVKGPHEVVSDKAFRVTDEADDDWLLPKFDDSKWGAAREQGATPFSCTVYGMKPGQYRFINAFAASANEIEQALEALRRAKNGKDALQSLDRIERAVMRARRHIQGKKKPPQRAGKK